MNLNFNELHSLIIYIVVGYTLLLPLIMLSLRLFHIRNPLYRLRIYLAAFLTPPSAFILYHTVLAKRCDSGLPPVWAEHAFHLFCLVSESMLTVFIPLLFLLITFAFLKALAALLMIRRLEKSAIIVNPDTDIMIRAILRDKSRLLSVTPPKVIFSSREGFAAFTTGFIKPVMVLNHRIVKSLSYRELEAVISHELVHIKQRDTLKSWLLHMIRDITLLNPLSALLLKGYLLENEILVDQKAANLANQRYCDYAETLLKVWRSILERKEVKLAAISSFTGHSGMERRVKALLKPALERSGNSDLQAAFSGMLLISATLIILGFVC